MHGNGGIIIVMVPSLYKKGAKADRGPNTLWNLRQHCTSSNELYQYRSLYIFAADEEWRQNWDCFAGHLGVTPTIHHMSGMRSSLRQLLLASAL